MRNFVPALLILSTLSFEALGACRDIVSATVAELRAGAANWSEEMERVARAAAGSACVKAGGDATASSATGAAISEQAVPAAGGAAAAASSAPAPASSGEGKEEEWHPLKGFKFNPVTGSPGKKPYERRREVNETEAEREARQEEEPEQ